MLRDRSRLMGRFARPEDVTRADCRDCGACCATSAEWPRFTLEDDEDLARIPPAYAEEGGPGMRCDGDRCSALLGAVGVASACAVYEVRPLVCRDCEPGDAECRMARALHGL